MVAAPRTGAETQPMRSWRQGDAGPEVGDIQQRLIALGARIDPEELGGVFGASTDAAVRAFQGRRALSVDGQVGPDTWGQLVEAGWRLGDRQLYLRAPTMRGDDVRELQRKLNALGFDAGREDGMVGVQTDNAIREFQRNVGHNPDGIVGPETLLAVQRLRPPSGAPSRAVIREEETLRSMRDVLAGAIVAIDPAGEGADARAVFAIASSLADELAALGAKPAILRGEDEQPSASDRARTANELDASACLSIGLADESRRGSTPCCSYFGSTSTHSPMGKRLAELITAELAGMLGAIGRTQRLTAAILRETQMPAVRIEPLAVGDEELREPDLPARLAQAVATGLSAFFSG